MQRRACRVESNTDLQVHSSLQAPIMLRDVWNDIL